MHSETVKAPKKTKSVIVHLNHANNTEASEMQSQVVVCLCGVGGCAGNAHPLTNDAIVCQLVLLCNHTPMWGWRTPT